MPKKIVSAGLLCLDITPVFKDGPKKDIKEILVPGKLIEMNKANIHIGGSVANSGLAFQYFGADVTLIGKIGKDQFGSLVKQSIQSYGNHNDLIESFDCDTSYTVILVPPGTDRIFLHYPGADNSFGYNDIPFEKVRGADLFHFGYPTVMEKMYHNGGSELIQIFKEVKELGVLTSLDMSAVDPESEAAKADWLLIIKKLIPYVDFFVPSVEELCFLMDRRKHDEWMERSRGRDITEIIDIEEDVKPLADRLINWGAKIVLIKCGVPGMYLKTADKQTLSPLGSNYIKWADLSIFEPSYRAERYCSGTGAGDVSLAAFLTAAIENYDPQRCLQLATAEGTFCVSAYDALSGLKTFDEALKKIDSGWTKNPGK